MPIVQNRFGKRSKVSPERADYMIKNDGAILIKDETPTINAKQPEGKITVSSEETTQSQIIDDNVNENLSSNEKSLTKADLQKMLDEKGIAYDKRLGEEKLKELLNS